MPDIKKFVIQKHFSTDHTHWDLMLHVENALQTFRLELPPEKIADQLSLAEKISDHPLKFLTYQGTVNQGTGTVEIADKGTYQTLTKTKNRWQILFDGQILKGEFTLTLTEGDNWQLSLS
ncbi:MAG: hypothetical protein FVQ80_09425 [Planctomycetes bacterium]|nr:hypothetical protein [Planctomycetota bacterium]